MTRSGASKRHDRGRRLGEGSDVCDRSSGGARKGGDFLLDAVFEDVEIRRAEAADVVAFFIGHDDGDEHLLYVEPDGGVLLGHEAGGGEGEDQAHFICLTRI
jgi:hypothetical protein